LPMLQVLQDTPNQKTEVFEIARRERLKSSQPQPR